MKLLDREYAAAGEVVLLPTRQIAPQPRPHCFNGVQVARVWSADRFSCILMAAAGSVHCRATPLHGRFDEPDGPLDAGQHSSPIALRHLRRRGPLSERELAATGEAAPEWNLHTWLHTVSVVMMARGAQLLVFTGPRVPDGLRHVPLAPGERLRRHRERHAVQLQPDVFLPPRRGLLHIALDPCLSLLQLGGIESTDLRQSFPEIPVSVELVRHRPLRHSQLQRRTDVQKRLCRHFFTKSTIVCSCATDNLRFRPQLPHLAWGLSVPLGGLHRLDCVPHRLVRRRLAGHVHDFTANVDEAHALLGLEVPRAGGLKRVQPTGVDFHVHGRHDYK